MCCAVPLGDEEPATVTVTPLQYTELVFACVVCKPSNVALSFTVVATIQRTETADISPCKINV